MGQYRQDFLAIRLILEDMIHACFSIVVYENTYLALRTSGQKPNGVLRRKAFRADTQRIIVPFHRNIQLRFVAL